MRLALSGSQARRSQGWAGGERGRRRKAFGAGAAVDWRGGDKAVGERRSCRDAAGILAAGGGEGSRGQEGGKQEGGARREGGRESSRGGTGRGCRGWARDPRSHAPRSRTTTTRSGRARIAASTASRGGPTPTTGTTRGRPGAARLLRAPPRPGLRLPRGLPGTRVGGRSSGMGSTPASPIPPGRRRRGVCTPFAGPPASRPSSWHGKRASGSTACSRPASWRNPRAIPAAHRGLGHAIICMCGRAGLPGREEHANRRVSNREGGSVDRQRGGGVRPVWWRPRPMVWPSGAVIVAAYTRTGGPHGRAQTSPTAVCQSRRPACWHACRADTWG